MPAITIKQVQEQIANKVRCCDCYLKKDVLLPCLRGKDSLVQCEECFEVFTAWVEKKISNEKVGQIYHERQVATMEGLGFKFKAS